MNEFDGVCDHALTVDSGVAPSQGFWSPEHTVQFSEMVEEKNFTASFKSAHTEQGETVYDVELKDKTVGSINQKFGSMTNTLSAGGSRSVSNASFGSDFKVTVRV